MRTSIRYLILLVGSTVAVACGSDSPSAPSSSPPVDLAAAIAQMGSTSITGIAGAGAMMSVPVTTVPPAVALSACNYSPTMQGFVCPTTTAGGLTFSLSYFLADAAGHVQTQLDTKSTASIRTVIEAIGTVTLPPPGGPGPSTSTVAIDDHHDMTMSGLLSTLRTLNGTSKSHYVLTLTGTTPTLSDMDMTSTTANVVLPASNANGSAWPKSGTITSDMKTVSQVGSLPSLSITIHSVLTFNGTSIVTMAITVRGVTTTCKIDLSGKVAPVC
jgi:hypothetical protein